MDLEQDPFLRVVWLCNKNNKISVLELPYNVKIFVSENGKEEVI